MRFPYPLSRSVSASGRIGGRTDGAAAGSGGADNRACVAAASCTTHRTAAWVTPSLVQAIRQHTVGSHRPGPPTAPATDASTREVPSEMIAVDDLHN